MSVRKTGPRARRSAHVLFRGDSETGVATPTPSSKTTIVEHILYLGGYGRETPFTSTTESEDAAGHFAGPSGAVWTTEASHAIAAGAKHWSKSTLVGNLRGFGKGRAKWTNRWEVAQAQQYVKRWSEHLLEWSEQSSPDVVAAIGSVFQKRSKKGR